MPFVFKKSNLKYKNGQGQYVGINTVSDTATADQIAAIQTAGSAQTSAVNAAGQTQTSAVNSAGQTKVTAVNDAGAAQIAAVQAKGVEVISSIPQDYTSLSNDVQDLSSAFESLPTNETGLELLEKETGNSGLTETALAVIGLLFDRMPQNETATDIYYSLLLENERLLQIYEIWEAERSA